MEISKLLSCGKCHRWFSFSELISKRRKLYNIDIVEHCCPYCGNCGFTAKKDEKYFMKFEQTNDTV